ncbi:hypothetical protein PSN_3276 [Pseudomonas sp. NGC7]
MPSAFAMPAITAARQVSRNPIAGIQTSDLSNPLAHASLRKLPQGAADARATA